MLCYMRYISEENANDIIRSIKENCFCSIDMTDETAVVFASTNDAHIGQLRGAAEYILHSGVEELFVEEENAFPASPVGYYFPLSCMNESIGVICIEARVEDVRQYGQIIRRMVRMLMDHYVFSEMEQVKERTLTFFLDEWFQLTPLSDTTSICERSKMLSIDIKVPRVIAIMHVHNMRKESSAPNESVEEFGRTIHNIFQMVLRTIDRANNDICVSTGNDMIFLINTPRIADALTKLTKIKAQIESKYFVSIYTGLSPVVKDFREVGAFYRYAQVATRVARESGRGFTLYDDLSIELLLSNVQPQIKQDYLSKVFDHCSDAEIREWTNLLSVYFQCNGSISATADQLYMHKNTLQYKLNGIHSKTGYDPRNRSDSVILYLAVHILLANSTIALS